MYTGNCDIYFDGRKRNALVLLEPEEEQIRLQFPRESTPDVFGYRDSKEFDRRHKIENLNIKLPQGQICGGRITNLLLTSLRPGSHSVYDSALVRAFSLRTERIGIVELVFVPAESIVTLPVAGLSDRRSSELVYRDNRIVTAAGIGAKFGPAKARISGDRQLLVVSAKHNLFRRRDAITRALSLAQAGRIHYRAGLAGPKLELNFSRHGRMKPLGRIYPDDDLTSTFLSNYVSYELALSEPEVNRHSLAMDYLIDGCAGLSSLEHRVISLLVCLEIIDGSRTLSPGTTKSILSVTRTEADFIVNVRNSLIHEGVPLSDALDAARDKTLAHRPSSDLPDFANSSQRTNRFSSNFYFYFLDRMIGYVTRLVGMKSPHGELYNTYCRRREAGAPV